MSQQQPLEGEALLFRARGALYLWVSLLVFFTFGFVIFQVFAWESEVADGGLGFTVAFSCLLLGVLTWNWYVVLYLHAFEVRLDTDGELQFRSALRTRAVNVSDLVLIRPQHADPQRITIVFKTTSQTIRVFGHMDGLARLLEALRRMNPAIEVRRL